MKISSTVSDKILITFPKGDFWSTKETQTLKRRNDHSWKVLVY
jgi:hypothetical protein